MSAPGTPEEATPPTPSPPAAAESPDVLARLAQFAQLSPPPTPPAGTPLEFLRDVTVTVTARLGQVELPIGEILKLGPGAIVELEQSVAQPVELTVRGMVFATGEVVVVDDHFAVRIKELMPPRRGRGGQ